MFKVIRKDTNRLDIELSGKLDAEGMVTALDELVAKSKDIENGRMLNDVVEFHLPSLDAIAVSYTHHRAHDTLTPISYAL